MSSDAEIFSHVGLTKLPISGRHVPGSWLTPIAGPDPEREGLAHKDRIGLPVLAPVAAHAHPTGLRSFDPHGHDIPCTRNVGDQNQVEVSEAVDCESDSPLLSARYPV